MTEDEITLFLAEEINGGCIVPSPIGYDKCRLIAKRLIKRLQNTSSNSEYEKALDIYQKYFNSITTLEFGDWLRDRLNQQK